LWNQYRHDLIRGIGGKPSQRFLSVAKGYALNGQFQAPSLYDCPGFHKRLVATHARGKPIAKAHYLAFRFLVCHGLISFIVYT
jgi:hypothetical protein